MEDALFPQSSTIRTCQRLALSLIAVILLLFALPNGIATAQGKPDILWMKGLGKWVYRVQWSPDGQTVFKFVRVFPELIVIALKA